MLGHNVIFSNPILRIRNDHDVVGESLFIEVLEFTSSHTAFVLLYRDEAYTLVHIPNVFRCVQALKKFVCKALPSFHQWRLRKSVNHVMRP